MGKTHCHPFVFDDVMHQCWASCSSCADIYREDAAYSLMGLLPRSIKGDAKDKNETTNKQRQPNMFTRFMCVVYTMNFLSQL